VRARNSKNSWRHCHAWIFTSYLVTNEVGWGIVPDNVLARQFRDLAGWANQRIAAAASEVVLTVAGIPMIVKKATSCP
jgi:adenosyl cobinamide kinase/adenosyl cobinamide phosphate guanylyltransferase